MWRRFRSFPHFVSGRSWYTDAYLWGLRQIFLYCFSSHWFLFYLTRSPSRFRSQGPQGGNPCAEVLGVASARLWTISADEYLELKLLENERGASVEPVSGARFFRSLPVTIGEEDRDIRKVIHTELSRNGKAQLVRLATDPSPPRGVAWLTQLCWSTTRPPHPYLQHSRAALRDT